jgi:glutamyl-tRNA synthetase
VPTLDGRFAPSPTGELHVGNLRTGLLAWLHARSEAARFLIRIEDLDVGRVREHFVAEQLDDLRAIGLDWDGEPVRQSQRDHLYRRALDLLRSQDRVYRCFCSRREIREAASAQHGDRPDGAYPGTCAVLSQSESDQRADAGDPFALRLRADGATVEAIDTRHGTITDTVDDLVLVRRDGAFAYNLAVVVDDAEQGIGEVVRGDDLLPSTPDQAFLCDLLGLPRPQWTHVPLILGPDRARLAKRHGAVTLSDLAAQGVGADDVRQFLSVSLGLTQPGEPGTPDRLVARFGRETVPGDPLVLSREIRDFLV